MLTGMSLDLGGQFFLVEKTGVGRMDMKGGVSLVPVAERSHLSLALVYVPSLATSPNVATILQLEYTQEISPKLNEMITFMFH
ncbi:hypothetical protein DPMN_119147 [Dreissena polymorpha]|uniref:Uncharacterized protein n=1 Tax=Dreissena polymorpha TaxID=45954 RepID=A0A9D4JQZ6_DREPO|nr:hypothetical protein DPMN_119147 [Dreissena polymorpha]